MLAAAARADKSRCFCCESDFKIVSPASSVSLAVVCARSNVSERVSALETEFTSASLRSSSLSTAKEFLPPPPPPPLDSTSKFPRDDFDFSNFCARVCERERERERRVSCLDDGPKGTPKRRGRACERTDTRLLGLMTLSQISKRLSSSRDERDVVSPPRSRKHTRKIVIERRRKKKNTTPTPIDICMCLKKKSASTYRCGLLFSSSHFSVVLSSLGRSISRSSLDQ